MKNKTMMIGVMLLLVMMLSLMTVMAATFNTPATDGTIKGSYVFNVTSDIGASTNCTVTGSRGTSTGSS